MLQGPSKDDDGTSLFRTGELRVEDGVVTYKIKDSQGTLASGNLGEVANPFRQVQYLVIRAQRYSAADMVDMRLSAINLYAGHETEVEDFEEGDGTAEGVGESDEAKDFVTSYESKAKDSFGATWLGPWPALRLTCTLAECSFSFSLVITVDILGTLTVTNCALASGTFDSMSESEQEAATAAVLGLSTVQELSLAILVSSFVAMFFATFILLPYAQALYTAAMIVWVLASIALIIVVADHFIHGKISRVDAAWGLFTLVWGLIIAGTQISQQGIFGKIFGCLDKYRGGPLPEWGYHTTFFWASRLMIGLLGVAVVLGILASPS